MTPLIALTIAGSDSSGGAGIQADLKTFAALGVYGASAITALTAQNTLGVRAVKTGMLATADVVRAVAAFARAGRLPRLVVDPVMVTSSGDRLLEEAAERAYVDELLPHATVLTPNLREAEALLGGAPVATIEDQREAARALGALGPQVVVIKGGHPLRDAAGVAVDVVWDGKTVRKLSAPRVPTPNNHGTGCSFASAVAAGLTAGLDVWPALEQAKHYVHAAISGAAHWRLGAGHGPLDHFGWGPGPTA